MKEMEVIEDLDKMESYGFSQELISVNNEYIKKIAKNLNADFIHSKAHDWYGIRHKGIRVYFQGISAEVPRIDDDNNDYEIIESVIDDINHQIATIV